MSIISLFDVSDNSYLFVTGQDLPTNPDGLFASLETPLFAYTGTSTLSFWTRKSSAETTFRVLIANEALEPTGYQVTDITPPVNVWTRITIDFTTEGAVQVDCMNPPANHP